MAWFCPASSPMAACKCSPPTSPAASVPAPERRSSRLEDRRRTSLGPFQALPCEVIQLILAHVPGECRASRVSKSKVIGSARVAILSC